MATRFYPAVRVPGAIIHGRCQGTWAANSTYAHARSPVHYSWELSSSNVDCGALTALNIKSNQQADHDLLWTRWITPPLEAVTLSGTLELVFKLRARWNDDTSFTTDSTVQAKVHAYITAGQTATVRTTLIDNSVDSAELHHATSTWQSISNAVAGSVLEGDCVMVEIGFRIVSSPTPTPTYPPSKWTEVDVVGTGASSVAADATAGTTTSGVNAWLEFSTTLTELPVADPTDNQTCATAELIPPTLPFDTGFVVTKGNTEAQKPVWYYWTAPSDMYVYGVAYGTNYACAVQVFTGGLGSCGSFITPPSGPTGLGDTWGSWAHHSLHRSMSGFRFWAVEGDTYRFRIQNATGTTNAVNSGGVLRFQLIARRTPATDDVYLPCGHVIGWRTGGTIVALTPDWFSSAPTGVAFDWTERTMDDLNGGTHSAYRLLVALHHQELVEILDAYTLNGGDAETDYIGDPIFIPLISTHPATLHCTRDGYVYIAHFGTGYLFVVGTGTVPAILNAVSDSASHVRVLAIDASHGDNQAGAPYALDNIEAMTVELCAPWAISIDEATGDIYYVSGSIYVDMDVATQVVRRHNVNTDLNEVFATVPLEGDFDDRGLRGLQFLPGGGLLLCNYNVVQRFDSSGTLTQTYTPVSGAPDDNQALCDVKLTTDGTAFWVVDLLSVRLWRFDISSGAELESFPTYGETGSLVQMAIWQPTPPVEPPVVEDDCVMAVVGLDAPCLTTPSASCIVPYTPGRAQAVAATMDTARLELNVVED